jgi:hypothetical protein
MKFEDNYSSLISSCLFEGGALSPPSIMIDCVFLQVVFVFRLMVELECLGNI